VVAITSKDGEKETAAIMGRHAKTGEVYNLAADNEGGSSIGKWELEEGDAVLELRYVTGQGKEGGVKLRHHLEDDDTLIVTIELPQPIKIKMLRAKK
jgi:hypothetical protein